MFWLSPAIFCIGKVLFGRIRSCKVKVVFSTGNVESGSVEVKLCCANSSNGQVKSCSVMVKLSDVVV